MTATARNSAGVVVGKYAVPGARCGRAESYVTIDRVAGIAVRHPEHCGRFRLPDGDRRGSRQTAIARGLTCGHAAAVDRLLHRAHVVVTEGQSKRLADALEGKGVRPLATPDSVSAATVQES